MVETEKFFEFDSDWTKLDDRYSDAPKQSGVYALGLESPIQYPLGDTPVFYIGKAKTLRNRLSAHSRNKNNNFLALVSESNEHSVFYRWRIEEKHGSYERKGLRSFISAFGVKPLGNRIVTQTRRKLSVDDMQQQSHTEDSIPLDQLFDNIGREYIIRPKSCSITFGPKGSYREPGSVYIPDWSGFKNIWIRTDQYNWNKDKFVELLRIANRTTTKTSSHKAKFSATHQDLRIPEPHTWEEIALVKVRQRAGTYVSTDLDKEYTAKIYDEDLLLGKAQLGIRPDGRFRCRGKDEAYIPQTTNERENFQIDHSDEDAMREAGKNLEITYQEALEEIT